MSEMERKLIERSGQERIQKEKDKNIMKMCVVEQRMEQYVKGTYRY